MSVFVGAGASKDEVSPTCSYAALQIDACDTVRAEGWPDRTQKWAVPCGLIGPCARAHACIRSLACLGRGDARLLELKRPIARIDGSSSMGHRAGSCEFSPTTLFDSETTTIKNSTSCRRSLSSSSCRGLKPLTDMERAMPASSQIAIYSGQR